MVLPLPSEEEIRLVKSFIIIPTILTKLERDSKVIKESVKAPEVYADMMTFALQQATKDLSRVRRDMFKRGVKVYDTFRDEDGVTAKYLCRGYHRDMTLLWELIRAEAYVMMRGYFGITGVDLSY